MTNENEHEGNCGEIEVHAVVLAALAAAGELKDCKLQLSILANSLAHAIVTINQLGTKLTAYDGVERREFRDGEEWLDFLEEEGIDL